MLKYITALILIFVAHLASSAQVGIGTNTPDGSAKLEVQSTDKGLLIPRMTSTERAAISSPAVGLIVFQTDATAGFYYFTGIEWLRLIASGTLSLDGLTDAKVAGTNFTNSLIVGHKTTGVLNNAIQNTALGINSLKAITEGDWNTGVGYNSLAGITTGFHNTSIGNSSLVSNAIGNYNTAVGSEVLTSSTTSSNTGVGARALKSNTTGGSNSALGMQAATALTTAHYNTAIGWSALWANQTGHHNTAIGASALSKVTTGDHTAVGLGALENATNPISNTAVGYWSMNKTTTGGQNTAMGENSMSNNTTGSQNTAFGRQSLFTNLIGTGNAGYGFRSLYSNTADNNTAVGYRALYANTTGTNNTAIGYNAGDGAQTYSNATAIGANSQVTASNSIQLGDPNVTVVNTSGIVTSGGYLTNGNGGFGTTTPDASAQLDVNSTEKGFLVPRMTTTQRDNISSPANGLLIYNTTDNELQIHKQAPASTFGMNTISGYSILFPANAILQSFTSVSTGSLMSMDLNITDFYTGGTLTITVYNSNNGTGSVLGTASLSVTSTGVKRFVFSSPPSLTNTSVYSFTVTTSGSTDMRLGATNTGVYSGGSMYFGGSPDAQHDLYFECRIQAAGTWVNL